MFGQATAILHQGRWTLYAQRGGAGFALTLVGDPVPAIAEQRDAAGRITVAAAPAIESVALESTNGKLPSGDHPFTDAEIARELKALPTSSRPSMDSEVTKAGVIQ